MSDQPEKVELTTPDLAAEQRAAFEELFPGVIADGVLDAERLGALLDIDVTAPSDGRERFGLSWAGKKEAIQSLLTPSRGTLVPDLDRSIDFDAAENVFIEGDNLEVLKLLQKAYNDKIDLIYIDPPYNTGNDFVYNDDFADGLRGYLEYTGQLDDDGHVTSTDTDKVGRLHSRWLSMMYPRLVLARNLLRQDGVLFVSIDDGELGALKSIADSVFGESNLVSILAVELSKTQGMKVRAAQNGQIVKNHEYVLAYARDISLVYAARQPLYDASEVYDDHYDILWDGGGTSSNLFDALSNDSESSAWFSLFKFPCDKKHLRQLMQISPEFTEYFLNEWASRVYRASPIALRQIQSLELTPGEIVRFNNYILQKNSNGTVVQLQSFIDGVRETDDYAPALARATIRGALWKGFHSDMMNVAKEGGVELKNGKKPVRLIQQLVKWGNRPDGLVMDFFAGSGTTAHAVAAQNAEDGGHRRSISVNIPEPTREDSAPFKAGYRTVADITFARLKWVAENVEGAAETGLRVVSLGSSNFRSSARAGDDDQLDLTESTLVDKHADATAVAAEVLLKEGVTLDAAWTRHDLGGAEAIVADGVAMVTGLELDNAVVDAALGLQPRVLVFLEDGFAGRDEAKANAFTRARNLGITMKTV